MRQKKHPLANLRYFDNRLVFLHNFCLTYRGDILTCFHQILLQNIENFKSYEISTKNIKISKILKISRFQKKKFQIFIFYSNKPSLQNGNMLEKYQAHVQKPINKTELKSCSKSYLERLSTKVH